MQKFRSFGFILVAIFTVVFSVSARNVDTPKVSVKQQRKRDRKQRHVRPQRAE